MSKIKIAKRVFKKERTVPVLEDQVGLAKHRAAVLFLLFMLPYVLSMWLSGQEQSSVFTDSGKSAVLITVERPAGSLELTLEEYVKGVLPAVILPEYEIEALKAQAVLVRTQVLLQYQQGTEPMEAYYLDREQLRKKWGEHYECYMAKMIRAAEETKGMYLAYQGHMTVAPYFAVSAGNTRNMEEAADMVSCPYLQSKECLTDFLAGEYLHKIKISGQEFRERLVKTCGGEPCTLLPEIERDSAGYVKALSWQIQTEERKQIFCVTGEEFRSWFTLPSSCFEITVGEQVEITVKGVGHGFGMSQFAANQMALQGSDYIQILTYFFTNIAIDKFE